jgi:AhpD family alkylhydroperoxidase
MTSPDRSAHTDESFQEVPVRLDFDAHAEVFSRALSHLDTAAKKQLDLVDFDARLRELVRIRASQLNGCAYCIDMHTKDARAIGESEQRIYALPAWRETAFFTPGERAALAFTEAVTLMAGPGVSDEQFAAVAEHYSPEQIAALLSLIVMINAWNAVGATTHTWAPGSYEREG